MAIRFNPLTGNFDFTGSGGGGGGSAFFSGEVATYADLPLDGTAALNSRWLVRSNSGTWPFSSYKQAGVYVRKAIVGASRDNDYQLTDTSFFDVMSDSAFLLYDNADATKNLKFQLSGITTGTTRTLTAPDASGVIVLGNDTRIANIRASSVTTIVGSATDADGVPVEGVGGNGGSLNLQGGTRVESLNGGNSGTINLQGGSGADAGGAGANGGSITSNGATGVSAATGGSLNMSGGNNGNGTIGFRGGNITTTGTATSAGGDINTSGGGSINTSGGGGGSIRLDGSDPILPSGSIDTRALSERGGNIETWGNNSAGGSISTYDGGGSINTRGKGSIEFGTTGQRTTLTGTATANRAISLPDASGTIALTSNFAAPPAIGNTTPAAGTFTTLAASTSLTLGTSGILSGGTNTVEQRNTTSGQTFRLYNTVSGTADANYERGFLRWSSNVLQIGTEKLGTGTARALEFQTDGVTRLTINTDGSAGFTGNITANNVIGQSGAVFLWSTRTRMYADADGRIRISNNAQTDFDRLQFGGTTSSFPALKRSSTVLQARLADDSDFAPIQGRVRIHQNAVSEMIVATHTLTLFDAAGTAYKVPCVAA
jgi:hypothetical protein